MEMQVIRDFLAQRAPLGPQELPLGDRYTRGILNL